MVKSDGSDIVCEQNFGRKRKRDETSKTSECCEEKTAKMLRADETKSRAAHLSTAFSFPIRTSPNSTPSSPWLLLEF